MPEASLCLGRAPPPRLANKGPARKRRPWYTHAAGGQLAQTAHRGTATGGNAQGRRPAAAPAHCRPFTQRGPAQRSYQDVPDRPNGGLLPGTPVRSGRVSPALPLVEARTSPHLSWAAAAASVAGITTAGAAGSSSKPSYWPRRHARRGAHWLAGSSGGESGVRKAGRGCGSRVPIG